MLSGHTLNKKYSCFTGLKYDPENQQLHDGLAEVRTQSLESKGPANPFASADIFMRLRNDPRTKAWLDDPEYIRMINDLQNNPNSLAHRYINYFKINYLLFK